MGVFAKIFQNYNVYKLASAAVLNLVSYFQIPSENHYITYHSKIDIVIDGFFLHPL